MTEIAREAIDTAVSVLNQGGIIAYPTEAVYGLGCDPFNEHAVMRLLDIKKRPPHKGLILIAATWQQIANLTHAIPPSRLQSILEHWPGPYTFVFPASTFAPDWICGPDHTVALRITDHPIARKLCEYFEKPIVSTSANLSGEPPIVDAQEIKKRFNSMIDYILGGVCGDLQSPTEIRDAVTNKIFRSS